MVASQQALNPIARQAIERCGCEIAAAWDEINAAFDLLRRSQWLLKRWADQAKQTDAGLYPKRSPRPRVAGMFIDIENPDCRGQRRNDRRTIQ